MAASFTCIIPWSGKNNYLSEALKSVFDQERPFDEVIVVCDTQELPSDARDKRVKWMLTGGGALAGRTRNIGVSNSLHEWIVFLDHDDLLMPNYLSTVETKLNENTHSLLVQLRYYSEGKTGNFVSANGWHYIPTGTCVRKQSFLEVGGFPPMSGGEDLVLFRRLERNYGESAKIAKVLALYRIHSESDVSSNKMKPYYSTLLCTQIDGGNLNISWDEARVMALEMSLGVGVDPKKYREAKAESEARSRLRLSYAHWLAGRHCIGGYLFLKAFWISPNYFWSKVTTKWRSAR
jgi:glycosyltransferase involved in cell wall biosynthesis